MLMLTSDCNLLTCAVPLFNRSISRKRPRVCLACIAAVLAVVTLSPAAVP